MPATDNQGSFLNRISIRRNQVTAMDNNTNNNNNNNNNHHHDQQELDDLDHFQKYVADRFSDLLLSPHSNSKTTSNTTTSSIIDLNDSPDAINEHDSPAPPPPPSLLSISWFRSLLDAFLCCESEFKVVLMSGRDPSQFSKHPLDRLISDLMERSIRALDVCNAITHGVQLLHQWHKLAQIAVTSLQQKPLGEGQVRRARKALATLLTSMVCDDHNKENAGSNKLAERTWSFGRRAGGANNNNNNNDKDKDRSSSAVNFQSLSWPVAKSWSASRQIQAMAANLVPPRGGDQSTGLVMPLYIMSTILVFVMWALVAAVPCQERNGLGPNFHFPRQFGWAQPLIGLQDKIAEEWKKKEKKGTSGLLEELQRLEKVAHSLVDFADSFVYPLEEEKEPELAAQVAELAEICQKMEEGLGPLQQQVREVFRRLVRSREEVLDIVDQVTKLSAPIQY